MTYEFRDAVRERTHLVIGLAGASGTGKTMSALRLAQGIVGRDKKFGVIDTESGRALHYSPRPGAEPDFDVTFRFQHMGLEPPFSPDAYTEAIKAAAGNGYGAVVVDSFSHVHDGEGGQLDMQQRELDEMVKRALSRKGNSREEWQVRNAMKRSSWINPKMAHKRMVQQLLRMQTQLILCLRAEDKVDFVEDSDGKIKVVPMQTASGYKGWIPICDKKLPYELICSFILTPDKPGVPVPIKLQEQHKPFFPPGQQITEKSGELLAAWARGGSQPASATPAGVSSTATPTAATPRDERAEIIAEIRRLLDELKPTATDRASWKETYLGRPDADPRLSDLAALSDYVKFLRLRAGKAA